MDSRHVTAPLVTAYSHKNQISIFATIYTLFWSPRLFLSSMTSSQRAIYCSKVLSRVIERSRQIGISVLSFSSLDDQICNCPSNGILMQLVVVKLSIYANGPTKCFAVHLSAYTARLIFLSQTFYTRSVTDEKFSNCKYNLYSNTHRVFIRY